MFRQKRNISIPDVFKRLLCGAGLIHCLLTAVVISLLSGCYPRGAVWAEQPLDGARNTPPVTLESGMVTGVQLPGGVQNFRGIPFAAAPVNGLRWKPPQPVVSWDSIRTCRQYGPACSQVRGPMMFTRLYTKISEDCLYLNVWSPEGKEKRSTLPVMVWIHGGAFMTGSASDDFFNGQDLAREGVVVVTLNYRLGPFGFLAHPLLSKESEHNVSGNYGLLDQIAALKWVKKNIAAFGGNPENVTIFGESGGGRSVAHLMVSPLAENLFHRAIIQSSSVYRPIHHLRESWYGRPSMEEVGLRVASRLGCDKANDPIAALRIKSVEDILDAAKPSLESMLNPDGEGTPYEPIVDGWVIPDDPGDLFDAGRQQKVPLIVGITADESSLFTRKLRLFRPWRMKKLVAQIFPENNDEILAIFPMDNKADAFQSINNMLTDLKCTAPLRSIARSMEKAGSNVWFYQFSRVRPDFMGKRYGAWHGSEIRFVFNSLDRGASKVEEVDRKLADTVSSYWAQFAATGNPNRPDLPNWPIFKGGGEVILDLGDTVQIKQGLRKESNDLFQKIEQEVRARRRDIRAK